MKKAKKKNAQDATLRNIRASNKKLNRLYAMHLSLVRRVFALEDKFKITIDGTTFVWKDVAKKK